MITPLKQIKLHLGSVLNTLEIKEERIGSNQIRFTNLHDVRSAINAIDELNIFQYLTDELKKSSIFKNTTDAVSVSIQEGESIKDMIGSLKKLGNSFFKEINNILPEEDQNSINIKLPSLNDFDELSKYSRDIHLSLTQVILNDEINGQTKIVSVENGSIWFNVFLGSSAALGVIASIVWSAAVVYKKIQEGRALEQHVRALDIKNDSIEDIRKAQEKLVDLMIQAETEYIDSEHFKNNQPENIERIKKSLITIVGLIQKGAEIHPAIDAPENVSNLFPNMSNLIGIDSKIKKLADPNEKK